MGTTRKQTQFIHDGRVLCPVRHVDVDIEQCLGCRHLADVDLDSRHPHVVCRVEQYDLERIVPV